MLASPELTGLSRQDLTALAASLDLRHAAAREQRLHLDRGHFRRARTGPAAPFKYTLETQLLAAIYHHRLGMPYTHVATLLGAHHWNAYMAHRIFHGTRIFQDLLVRQGLPQPAVTWRDVTLGLGAGFRAVRPTPLDAAALDGSGFRG
jgi:hypothetical protein